MLFLPPAQIATAPAPHPDASSALNLDLAGALKRARAENPMLQAAKARVEERRGAITSARADALPQMNLVADYTRTRDVSAITSGMIADQTYAESLVKPRNFFSTQALISQPIFYWGKLGTAVEVAKMGEREASHAYTTAELDTLHGVAMAYINVQICQAELEVVQTRLRTAEQFLFDVKAKLEAQTATELDRLRAESEYLAVVPENLQADANFKRAVELLNGQLGLDPRTPLNLAELGNPDLSNPLGTERSELAQFKQQEAMYLANDQIIKADMRPKVDFSASYGYQANHSPDLGQSPYDTWKVNLNMRIPVFDGLRTSGRRSQNRAQLEQVRQARVDKERSIAVERSTAERELQKALAFFEAAKKAHDASLEALRNSRESFEQGLITSLDLLQAERTERQQESQRRRAALGIWSAVFNQRRALGLPPL